MLAAQIALEVLRQSIAKAHITVAGYVGVVYELIIKYHFYIINVKSLSLVGLI
ncbi:hypothetical protein CRC_00570 [Cylindrospermopsis raciborskii CS-505]|jgi:hypothetical protein|nr:hypothetical protein CRC_00570 [Cylindrospermopsis raciborskii CS-505]